MEFYFANNLVREDFLSCLLEWTPGKTWQLKAIGYPFLTLNVQRRVLLLNFTDLKRNCETLSCETTKTIIQFDKSNGSILLENPNSTIDSAICFAKTASLTRFSTLFESYRDTSIVKRCLFVEAHLQQRGD